MAWCALVITAAEGDAQARRLAEPRVTDTTHVTILKTRDGSTLVGRVVEVGADTIRLQTSLGPLAIARSDVAELREVPASAMRRGTYWPADPNVNRLFFGPTGRMLAAGDGYFADHYLFFLSTTHGVDDDVTIGGGMSVFPAEDFSDNVFYLTPKMGLVAGEQVNVAVGALIAYAGALAGNELEDGNFGIAYGVATIGSPDASVTVGTGIGYTGRGVADRPIVMLGAEMRLSRRAAFVTENYILPGVREPLMSYGVRFFGEKISVDLAFINIPGANLDFPGIPFVGFAVHY